MQDRIKAGKSGSKRHFFISFFLAQRKKNSWLPMMDLVFMQEQRYTYKVLQTIQMKLIFICVWAEWAVLGSAKTALKFKYET